MPRITAVATIAAIMAKIVKTIAAIRHLFLQIEDRGPIHEPAYQHGGKIKPVRMNKKVTKLVKAYHNKIELNSSQNLSF